MIPTNSSFASSLSGMLGKSSLSEDELAFLRRQAWWEQGVLIISPWDRRLTTIEADSLREIAERIYGGPSS